MSGADAVVCANLTKLPEPAIDTVQATDANLDAVRARFKMMQAKAPSLSFLTFGGTVNRQKVAYFNKNDLTALVKGNTTGYGVNAVYSVLFRESMYSVGASVTTRRIRRHIVQAGYSTPLYLAPDKNKLLTGGIALGYVTHGDGFGASVFIGKTFSFF